MQVAAQIMTVVQIIFMFPFLFNALFNIEIFSLTQNSYILHLLHVECEVSFGFLFAGIQAPAV